jgi:hypothetical protein
MATAEAFGTTSNLGIDAARQSSIDQLDELLEARTHEYGFDFIRPTRVLCPDECLTALGGTPLYFDSGHLSPVGSRYLVNRIPTLLNPTTTK